MSTDPSRIVPTALRPDNAGEAGSQSLRSVYQQAESPQQMGSRQQAEYSQHVEPHQQENYPNQIEPRQEEDYSKQIEPPRQAAPQDEVDRSNQLESSKKATLFNDSKFKQQIEPYPETEQIQPSANTAVNAIGPAKYIKLIHHGAILCQMY